MKSDDTEKASIVREEEFDLVAIDIHEDGMAYRDQMCWNVILDKPGKCPRCGIT